ncbi:MAG: gliding motility-associated C-terminal domain-containing protein [Bacteroidota bacterium]
MLQRIILLTISTFVACSLWGQNFEFIPIIDQASHSTKAEPRDPCALSPITGSLTMPTAVDGMSNSTTAIGETIYLCAEDRFTITDLDDVSLLTGDPDPLTTPFIALASYTCPPTVEGPVLDSVENDCIISRSNNILLTFDLDDRTSGEVTIANTTNTAGERITDIFNGGDPFQWWYAPITVDNTDGVGEDRFEGMPRGACVSVAVDQAFSVVYLNPISMLELPSDGDRCKSRINIFGGLPEFDLGEEYTVEAVNADDPSIRATLERDLAFQTQPSRYDVLATVPGIYNITISDGVSCSFIGQVDLSGCTDDEVVFESIGGTTSVGQEICVPVLVENFIDIVSVEVHVKWDTAVLEFGRYVDGFIPRGDVNPIDNGSIGFLSVLYADLGFVPQTLSDGDTLFTLCFIGKSEGESLIEFTEGPQFPQNGGDITILTSDEDVNINSIELNPKAGTVTVIDPDSATPILSNVKNACPMESNGSVELSVLGGNPPFQVSLLGPNPGDADGPAMLDSNSDFVVFDDLQAGQYQFLISEVNDPSAIEIEDFEILEADLDVSTIENEPSCDGGSDGSLQVRVAIDGDLVDDLSDYTFKWVEDGNLNDTISRDEIVNGLSQGAYTVFVEDNNGCSDFGRTSLFDPEPITTTPQATQASCSGVADGSIRLTNTEGGTAPYTFEWANGVTDPENLSIESGRYGYEIADANGCILQDTFLLTAETELVIQPTGLGKRDVSCFGFSDGAIEIFGTQDGSNPVNGDYIFTWSANATNIDNSVRQTSLVDSLSSDSYSVTLTNTGLPAGCQAVQDFAINEPDSLMVERVDITNVSSCSLMNPDGGITASFIGGTPTYVYEWSDTSGMVVGNTATLTDQPSGELILTVTDDNGCQTTIDTAIGTPPPPEIVSFDGVTLSCATDFTNLMVIAREGRPNFNVTDYMWSHDASISGPNAINVGPGIYTVTVIDSDGCANAAQAEVTSPPAIRTSQVDFKPACFATEDGEISVNVEGGNNTAGQNYDFEWSFNSDVLSTTSQLLNAAPQAYNLQVTDVAGCEFDTLITLSSLPRIVVDFPTSDISGVACFDTPASQCNGAAAVNAGYEGSGGGLFIFNWETTSEASGFTNNFSSSSLCAGFQQVRIVDTSGCEIIDSVLIPSPDEISLIVNSPIDVSCFGESDGSVMIGATGGNGGFTFAWNDGSTEVVRDDLSAQVYDITIIDQDGCTGQGQVEITEPQALLASIDQDETNNIICEGDANGRITVNVTGGNNGPLIYRWTNNVSMINFAAGLSEGTYLIDVEDSRGCTTQANYTVTEPTPITVQVEWDPIQCNGFQTGIRVANISGGNPGAYTFSVDDSPARPIDETITEFGGDRKISFFDAEGCRVDSIYNIEQPRPLEVDFVENLVEVDLGSSIDLDLNINGDLPIADIFWAQDGEPVDSSFMCAFAPCDNPTVNPLNNTVYTAFVTDVNDCMAEASITVNVDKNRNVYIPNVFAPNNAGFDTNDRFSVFTGSGVRKINYAKVFNRWGTMVADLTERQINGANATTEVWDGFIKGEKANQGVYIYIVEVEFIDDTVLLYRGDVALLR